MRSAAEWRQYLQRVWGEFYGSPEEELIRDMEALERENQDLSTCLAWAGKIAEYAEARLKQIEEQKATPEEEQQPPDLRVQEYPQGGTHYAQ